MTQYAVGIMSGTALDGIDVVLVSLKGKGIDVACTVIAFESYPYTEGIRQRIIAVSQPATARVDALCALNVELGRLMSQAVGDLLAKAKFSGRLKFIASHGQTLFHQPHALSPLVPSTLQIGDPSQLAYDHRTQVVFNFRMMDMVAGGAGAPLVPYSEYLLYRHKTRSVLLQNIGGIGNVTVLPKNCTLAEVIAFDTGPGNMMINSATRYYFNKSFDKDGRYAAKGNRIEVLFDELCGHEYLRQHPPKTTGRELFGEVVVEVLCARYPDQAYDVIHTLTQFSAYSIAKAYEDFIFPTMAIDEIIVGGGGAYNPVLMKALKQYLPNYVVSTQEAHGYSSDAKEAIAFVLLGNATLNGIASNVPSATGARHSVVLGQICPNPWGDGSDDN